MPILNQLITTVLPFIPKTIVDQVAKRYIAGVRLSDGVRVAKNLNEKGMMATMDLLGEDVKNNLSHSARALEKLKTFLNHKDW